MLKLSGKTIESLYLKNKTIDKAYVNGKLIFNKTKFIKPYYCEVEYIESTGTQYIDTEISPTNKTKWEIKFAFTKDVTGQLMGAGHAGDYRFNIGIESGKFRFAIGSGWTTLAETKDTDIHTWVLNSENSSCSLDNITVFSTYSSNFSETDYHIVLCKREVGSNYCSIKIYGSKVYTNNILVRDYIPVLDNNMQPCLYDKISKNLFYNQGTGSFLYGRQIHEVEYLETTGEQYIDTGLLSTANSTVDVTFNLSDTTKTSSNNVAIFGGRENSTARTFTYFFLASTSPQYFRFDFKGQSQIGSSNEMAIDENSKYRFTFDGQTIQTTNLTTNESVTKSLTASDLFTPYPISLFAVNTAGTIGTYLKGKIYNYKYSDGTNSIDLYPAVDENGKSFMFDRISHTIFDNSGTGEFLYPPVKLKYIDSNGEQ